MQNLAHLKAKKIKLLICDVDGVLTDGGLYFDASGNELKRFNAQDGHGLKMLLQFGIEVAVVSARKAKAVEHRMHDLGIKHYYQQQSDKKQVLNKLLKKLKLKLEEIAYIGDDMLDLPIMQQVGLAIAVNNAVDKIKTHAHVITAKNGGNGAVREVCDLLLKTQGLDKKYE